MRARSLALVLMLAGACNPTVQLDGKPCPCIAGYKCRQGLCVRGEGSDPPRDSGSDGPTDAGVSDASDGAACQPPSFCDSFDLGALGSTWSGMSSLGGTLSLRDVSPLSPPRALFVDVPARPGGGAARDVTLKKAFGAARAIRASAQVKIAPPVDTTRSVFLFSLRTEGTPFASGYEIVVEIAKDSVLVEERATLNDGGILRNAASGPPLRSGQWTAVVLETDFQRARLSIGEATTQITLAAHAPTKEELLVGIFELGFGGTAPWAFEIDDVAVGVTP